MPTTHVAKPTAPPFSLLTFKPTVPTAVLSWPVQATTRDLTRLAEDHPESFEMIASIARDSRPKAGPAGRGPLMAKRTKTTPAIGYLRVSSKGQTADDKDGLRRQRENIERYARTAGYDLIEWFEDGGVSGATELENRPALLDALARIAANGVKVMILEHSDRLARDLYVQEAIIKAFVDVKARILTADGIDLTEDDDSRRFIRQVMGAANEFAKRSLVRRMRAARERKRKTGARVEGVKPFGMLPGEATILQRLLDLHRKPKKGARLSLRGIAGALNAERQPTRSGVRWTKNTVARIVARERGHSPTRQRRSRNP